jgi:cytochrome P450
VINETLRFTPPLFGGIPRVTKKTETIGEWTVPAGISLSVNNVAVAHNPKYWKDPHLFNPERFMESDSKHPFAFIPFGNYLN